MPPALVNSDLSHRFRDYQLIRELDRGGMCIVCEAEERALSRRVALKILPPGAALDERQVARFRQEASICARLDHAHIVPVYAVGCDEDVQFFAMKYIDGCSLSDLIEQLRTRQTVDAQTLATSILPIAALLAKPIGDGSDTAPDLALVDTPVAITSGELFRLAASCGLQAAEALHYAHNAGVIHCDIKPANLLLDQTGHLWLTDFGMAGLINELPRGTTPAAGGTLRYLSPEQAAGDSRRPDHRSDIYSLGVTLYELVTLQPAITGETPSQIWTRIVSGKIRPPSSLIREVPAELDRIICRAIAADPQERYATAADMADDLRKFLNAEPIATVPTLQTGRTSPPRIRSWQFRAAIAACVIVVAGLTGLLRSGFWGGAVVPAGSSLAAGATPWVSTWKRLRELNQTGFAELSQRLARGDTTSNEEQRLLLEGPGFYLEELPGADREIAQLKLQAAEACYHLSRIHLEMYDVERQSKMLKQAADLVHPLVEDHDEPDYQLAASFVEMSMAEIAWRDRRREDAIRLGEQSIARARTVHLADPSNTSYRVTLASLLADYLNTMNGRLEKSKADQFLRDVNALLLLLAEAPAESWQSNRWLPYTCFQDAVADCRTDLVSNSPSSPQNEALLQAAIKDLAASNAVAKTEPWRVELLSRGNLVLASERCSLGRPLEAEQPLANAVEQLEQLSTSFPACVRYRLMRSEAQNFQAGVFKLGDKGTRADELYRLSAEIVSNLSRSLGGERQDRIDALGQLALTRIMQNQVDEATRLLHASYADLQETNGVNNLGAIRVGNMLAAAYCMQGRYDDCQQLAARNLVIADAKLGRLHAEVFDALWLVMVSQGLRGVERAPALGNEAIVEIHLKANSTAQSLATEYLWLSTTELTRGDQSLAESLARDSLAIMQNPAFLQPPLREAAALAQLARVLIVQQQTDEAESALRKCLQIRRVALGKNHFLVAETESLLGGCLTQSGNYVEARQLLVERWPLLHDAPQLSIFQKADALERIITLFDKLAEPAQASVWGKRLEEQLRDAIAQPGATQSTSMIDVTGLESRLGACLTALGNCDDARDLLENCYFRMVSETAIPSLRDWIGVRHQTMVRMVDLCQRQGDEEEATAWQLFAAAYKTNAGDAWSTALAAWEKLAARRPDSATAQLNRAICHLGVAKHTTGLDDRIKSFDEAEAILVSRALPAKYRSAARELLAACHSDRAQARSALTSSPELWLDLEHAMETRPDHDKLIQISAKALGHWADPEFVTLSSDRIKEQWQIYRPRDADGTADLTLAERVERVGKPDKGLLVLLAAVQYRAGRLDAARRSLSGSLSVGATDDIRYWLLLALVHHAQRRVTEAQQAYRQAVELLSSPERTRSDPGLEVIRSEVSALVVGLAGHSQSDDR